MPRAQKPSARRSRAGVAISLTSLCSTDARLGGAGRAWRTPLDPPPAEGASWPSLVAAFRQLAEQLHVADGAGTLAIALMPPLTEVRRLDLPPVRGDELQLLLSRNAGRYFVNGRGPQVVGAAPTVRRGRGVPVPVVAAAAPARLVAGIRAAASQAGWAVDSIVPAEGAWAAAALELWPSLARHAAFAIVAHEDRTDVLQLENGKLVGIRRFRAGAADAPVIADTLGTTARAAIAGSSSARKELAAALGLHGITVASPAGGGAAGVADQTDALAARFAESEIGPVLRSEDSVVGDRERTRRAAWILAAAAAAMLVLAAGVQYWGVHRQLRIVRAERAKLRPALASTLVGRTTVDAVYAQLGELSRIERASPQWSAVIAALTQSVPEEAHLTAIRTRDDSLVVDGLADHAARVFDALSKTRGLTEVKSASAVRRELQDNGSAKEHFTIAARAPVIVPPASPAQQAKPTTLPTSAATSRRPGP